MKKKRKKKLQSNLSKEKCFKAFTLIELLAVIVILVVIALITVPLILNVVERAKKQAFLSTAYGLIASADQSYFKAAQQEKIIYPIKYLFDGEQARELTGIDIPLSYKGETPKSGNLLIYKDGHVALTIWNGKYCVDKPKDAEKAYFVDWGQDQCVAEDDRDKEGPTIEFTSRNFVYTTETSYDMEEGVLLKDNITPSDQIKLKVTGTIKFGTVGENTLVYTATDEFGNETIVTRTIAVITQTTNFGYSGSTQTFVIPHSGYYEISAWGAQGGKGGKGYNNDGGRGGYGGYIKAKLYLPKGESITITVGGMGGAGEAADLVSVAVGGYGGYNGGSTGGYPRCTGEAGSEKAGGGGGGGGGATTVRLSDGSLIVQANGGSGGGGGADYDDSLGGCGGSGGGGTGSVCASDYSGWVGYAGSYSKAGTTKYGNIIKIESTNGAKSGHGSFSISFVGETLEETTYVFDYMAAPQDFIVPETGYYELSVWGAQGGKGGRGYNNDGGIGGLGGYVKTKVYLEKDTSLVITVGGMGGAGAASDLIHISAGGGGGYNGGSAGGYSRCTGEAGSEKGAGGGGGGGGATTIKLADGTVILQGNGGSGGGGGADYDDALGGCGGAGAGGTSGVCASSYEGLRGNPGSFTSINEIPSGAVTVLESKVGARSGSGYAIIRFI